MLKLSSMLVTLAVLAACASSPPPRYYRLVAEAVPPPASAAGARAADPDAGVVVGPFDLAEYLDRPQLVTRDAANGVAIAGYERWAEPLDANFQAVVAANVGRLLGSDRVLEFPAQSILRAGRRVTGRVLQFDVDGSGRAVLEVQWGVVDGAGVLVRPGRVSRHEAQAGGRDAAARVAALNATVTAFSEEVAAALR
jgi:hypothetical protein